MSRRAPLLLSYYDLCWCPPLHVPKFDPQRRRPRNQPAAAAGNRGHLYGLGNYFIFVVLINVTEKGDDGGFIRLKLIYSCHPSPGKTFCIGDILIVCLANKQPTVFINKYPPYLSR